MLLKITHDLRFKMEIFIKLNFQGQFHPSKWLHVLKNTKVSDQLIPCPHKSNLGCIIKSISSRSLHRCYMWFDAFKMRRLEHFNSSAGNMCLCQSVWWAKPTPAHQARDFSDASFSALCPQPPTSASSSSLFTTMSVCLSILIIWGFFLLLWSLIFDTYSRGFSCSLIFCSFSVSFCLSWLHPPSLVIAVYGSGKESSTDGLCFWLLQRDLSVLCKYLRGDYRWSHAFKVGPHSAPGYIRARNGAEWSLDVERKEMVQCDITWHTTAVAFWAAAGTDLASFVILCLL